MKVRAEAGPLLNTATLSGAEFRPTGPARPRTWAFFDTTTNPFVLSLSKDALRQAQDERN